jgi:DNA gyrase inhibitor GyrI
VVYVRSTGDYRVAAKDAWDRLNVWLAERQARRQMKRGFGLFHDNPRCTPAELLRYDACVEPATGLDEDPAAGIFRQILSGGTYAVHTHVGSYDPLGRLLSDLHSEWVPKQGLAVDYDRPFMAIYLNDPLLTREVHRRTELCIPVLPIRTELPVSGVDTDEDFVSPLMRRAVGLN